MDAELFKAAMAGVTGPVTIVTTRTADGEAYGTTVSAMMSLSLDPPMVVVALGEGSSLLDHVRETGRIGVNVLAADQEDLAMAFARSGADKFADASWGWDHDLPRLDGVGVWIAGAVDELVTGGDHTLLLTRVEAAHVVDDALPLVYGKRAFGTHTGLSPDL